MLPPPPRSLGPLAARHVAASTADAPPPSGGACADTQRAAVGASSQSRGASAGSEGLSWEDNPWAGLATGLGVALWATRPGCWRKDIGRRGDEVQAGSCHCGKMGRELRVEGVGFGGLES